MKNVTKILTAVVLCTAVFASDNRVSNLGGNAAFWPGDEANIAAFPAQINNHGFVQVTGMQSSEGSVGMVFSNGGANWSLGWSNSATDFVNLGWGKDGMGLDVNYKMSTAAETPNTLTWTASGTCLDGSYTTEATCIADLDCDDDGTADDTCVWTDTSSCSDGAAATEAACTNYAGGVSASGFDISFGKDLGDAGEIGVHFASGDGITTEGFMIDYRKSCGFWVFTDMVAHLNSPDDGDMDLDVDWFGHMDAGAADVMFAMGIMYDTASDGGMTLTTDLGVEAAVTDNVTVRGGMSWAYALTNDGGDQTGAVTTGDLDYGWSTGAGVNLGSFGVDFDLGAGFWGNPLGWVSGQDDDAAWGALTATYSF